MEGCILFVFNNFEILKLYPADDFDVIGGVAKRIKLTKPVIRSIAQL